MANDSDFVEFVLDQVRDLDGITCRAMFGGHTVYFRGKVVALVCDNQLFIKPTQAGREFIGTAVEAPPYPGAKDFFRIDEQLEDGDWLCQLIRLSERELPPGKPKKKSRA
jgi:TfoX/Sxy family transcriptional regulator of competence genes